MKAGILGKEERNFKIFLSDRTYFIPSYQRGYKWDDRN